MDLDKLAKALGMDKTLDDYMFYYGEYGLSEAEAKEKMRKWFEDDICNRIAELVSYVERNKQQEE